MNELVFPTQDVVFSFSGILHYAHHYRDGERAPHGPEVRYGYWRDDAWERLPEATWLFGFDPQFVLTEGIPFEVATLNEVLQPWPNGAVRDDNRYVQPHQCDPESLATWMEFMLPTMMKVNRCGRLFDMRDFDILSADYYNAAQAVQAAGYTPLNWRMKEGFTV